MCEILSGVFSEVPAREGSQTERAVAQAQQGPQQVPHDELFRVVGYGSGQALHLFSWTYLHFKNWGWGRVGKPFCLQRSVPLCPHPPGVCVGNLWSVGHSFVLFMDMSFVYKNSEALRSYHIVSLQGPIEKVLEMCPCKMERGPNGVHDEVP